MAVMDPPVVPARRHPDGRVRAGGLRARVVAATIGAGGLLAAGLLAGVGCAGSGPQVSGFALGDTRIVSVGELVELRLPRAEDGTRRWRVTSYDSYHLELVDNPKVVQRPDGSWVTRVVARARNVGESTLEVTRLARPGESPLVRRFTIRVDP